MRDDKTYPCRAQRPHETTCHLSLIACHLPDHQWRIQKILVGGDLKHKTSKIRMSSPKLRVIFRPKSEIQTFFSPKFRWSPKKKKVFTKIKTDFSPDSLRLGRWGGMHSEMEPNYSKQRLIFRPKSLLLGWWGGCIPPIPPLNPPLPITNLRSAV